MNVLIYRYGSICETDIIECLMEFGFHVDSITEEITNKHLSGTEVLSLVQNMLDKKNYDFVFTINFFPLISEICNIYHVLYLSLIVDSPVLELYSKSISNSYNRIFIFDKALYEEFHTYNPSGIFHLPLATNVNRWNKIINSSSKNQRINFSKKISFVGSLYTEKCPYDHLNFSSDYIHGYIEGLCHAQEKIYGYYFIQELLDSNLVQEIISSSPDFYKFPEYSRPDNAAVLAQYYIGSRITVLERSHLLNILGTHFPVDLYTGSDVSSLPVISHGTVKTHSEMPIIFYESQINLNFTAKSIRSGIPLRVWDILGCHGFLISNYQNEIMDYFSPSEDLIVYSSEEELVDLCNYYLSHPKQCHEIAENAYQKVKTQHTYQIRLSQILKAAFSL